MVSQREVDIIICGGGAAGCVMAGRLASADPTLEILIIEGGINNKDNPQVIKPAMMLSHLVPGSKTALFYVGKESEHLGGRGAIVPAGGLLGGGSSINFMMYTRAQRSDYDDWRQPGWTADDLKPLLAKTETYHIRKDDPNHGYAGPMHVTFGGHQCELGKEFLEVVKGYGGVEVPHDLEDQTSLGLAHWAKWIHPQSGRRQDAAHGFVHPHLEANDSKLSIQCESRVVRVVFDETVSPPRAVGVEYVPNAALRPNDPQAPITVMARKLVVVSAGSLSTPQILERSGVGAKERLEKVGVESIVDLPGVGESYQDHQMVVVQYHANSDTDTPDEFLCGNPEVHAEWDNAFAAGAGGGRAATNWIDAGMKIRPTEAEVATMSPAFKKRWDEYFVPKPDKPVMFMGAIAGFLGDRSTIPPGKYFSTGSYLEYPFSSGRIHITSPDVDAPPDFDPGYLNDDADMWPQVWAYKRSREFVRRMASYAGELAAGHPAFTSASPARCRDPYFAASQLLTQGKPGADGRVVSGAVPTRDRGGVAGAALVNVADKIFEEERGKAKEDIIYSAEDDKAIEDYIRAHVGTTWHSMGTCAMKPREAGGVVDARLNVYGTRALKCADLSICPANVGANTTSTALLVGEKAAMLIMEDLGITAKEG